jgi:tetratricopeptide (TPR) repeat protein
MARFSALGIAGLAVVAPQLLGGATDAMRTMITTLAAVLSALAAGAVLASGGSLGRTPWIGWTGIGLTLWTGVQTMPLPCGWVDRAWPERATLAASLSELGIYQVPQCTLSRSPGASATALTLTIVLTALTLASVSLVRLGHRRTLQRSVMWSGLLMAAVALIHTVANADAVFGVFVPHDARPGLLLAPLLNGNHCAALMALGVPLTLSEFRHASRIETRLLWAGACIALLACVTLTLSRSGMVGTAVSLGTYTALFQRDATHPGSRSGRWFPWLIAAAALTVTTVGGALLLTEFQDTRSASSKLTSFGTYLGLLSEHPYVGVGRFAFGDVAVQVGSGLTRADHPENALLQWAIEWGSPAALALALSLVVSVPWARLRGSTAAAAAALVGLAVHEMADFSLEMPGVAVPVAVLFGTVVGARARQRQPKGSLRHVLLATSAMGLGALLLTWPQHTAKSRGSTRESIAEAAAHSPNFDPLLHEALTSYPLDPVVYLHTAARAARTDSPVAQRWLNLAIYAAPRWAGPHIHAAYWLESKQRLTQAATELASALELDEVAATPYACEFLNRHPSPRLAWSLRIEPSQEQAEQLAQCLVTSGDVGASATMYAELVERFPSSLQARERLARLALSLGDGERSVALASELYAQSGEHGAGLSALLDALRTLGRTGEARTLFLAASPDVRSDRYVLLSALPALAIERDTAALGTAADELLGQARDGEDQVALARVTAEALASGGLSGKAVKVLQSAYRMRRDPTLLERAHALAEAGGLRDAALHMALELCHVRHRNQQYCRAGTDAERPR